MPWTEIFPTLSDEDISSYRALTPADEHQKLLQMFSHERLQADLPGRTHLVPLSLSPEVPYPDVIRSGTTTFLHSPSAVGSELQQDLVSRICNAARSLALNHPDAVIRLYLDPAWGHLADQFIAADCEVMLMSASSTGANPAKLWRYLALQEEERTTTFIGLHELAMINTFVGRTKALLNTELKMWRTPIDRRLNFRPIHPNRFGATKGYPILDLLTAYIGLNPALKEPADQPDQGSDEGKDSQTVKTRTQDPTWDRVDFDEFFLSSAIYPRAAFEGMLSLVEVDDFHSRWLLLDVEYSTWANPDSELLFTNPDPIILPEDEFCDGYIRNALVDKLTRANLYRRNSE